MGKSKVNFILFLLLACLWSGSFIGIKAVVTVWPPIFSAAIRVGIALCCLVLLIIGMRKDIKLAYLLRWKVWLIGCFSQGIPFSFLFWGERYISAGLAGILNSTVVIWTFLLSAIFLPQLNRFSLRKLAGLLVGIIGVVVIFWPMVNFEKNIHVLLGAAAVIVMAMSYALGAILNQHFLAGKTKIDFFANIFHQHCASLLYLIVISLVFEKWPTVNSLMTTFAPWVASLYLGIFSTALAWLIYYNLIREWDAVRASAVMYVVPALTLIWDYLFFATRPYLTEIIGVIAILAGVILIQLANFKRIIRY